MKIKKIILMLIVVAMMFSIVGMASLSSADEYTRGLREAYARMAEQEQALEAWNVLSETFTVNKDGTITYPDDYAGAWYSDGKLHIALTSNKRETTSRYNEILKGFDCIVFKTARYSINELDEVRDLVSETLWKDFSLVSHYVDVKENKIVLEFLELDETNIRQSLSSTIRSVASDKSISSDLFILERGTQVQAESTEMIGGMRLTGQNYGRFTLGIGVYRRGTSPLEIGYMIAGHSVGSHSVGSIGEMVWYEPFGTFPSTHIMGTVLVRMFFNGSNGDWAYIPRTNNALIPTRKVYGNSTTDIRTISGTIEDVAVGFSVMRYGMVSGYALATIHSQDVTRIIQSNIIFGLTRAVLTSGTSQRGDSGGPYYAINPGTRNYSFVGIHNASNVETSDGNTVWFTPYARFSFSYGIIGLP
jgi:hypothetical protein